MSGKDRICPVIVCLSGHNRDKNCKVACLYSVWGRRCSKAVATTHGGSFQ